MVRIAREKLDDLLRFPLSIVYNLCDFSIDGSSGGNRENEIVKAREGQVMRILIWHTASRSGGKSQILF